MSDRPDRYQADGALHSWIDRVARLEDVAQHHFGHGGDRGVLEIQFKTAAGRDRLRPHLGDIGYVGAFIQRRSAWLAGVSLRGIHLLRIARQGVERANFVEDVDIIGAARTHRLRIAGCEQDSG